jgi:general secretion pathway protein K
VLWISAALAAVGLSLSQTVRGESERVSTDLDGLRAYYLAVGAVEKAMIEVHWGRWYQDRPYPRGSGRWDYTFGSGVARVELIPEKAKFDLNNLNPQRLMRLLAALGVEPERAQMIGAGIQARKSGQGALNPFGGGPTFPGQGASFQETEELLAVPGVTPEIFYGTYVPNPDARPGEPRLIRRSGLIDCLSLWGSDGQVDINTSDPAVLAAVGVPPEGVMMIVEAREKGGNLAKLMPYLGAGAAAMGAEAHSIYTIRATAKLKLPGSNEFSDVRRTVAAQVKYMPRDHDTWIHVLRWYDTAWSNSPN